MSCSNFLAIRAGFQAHRISISNVSSGLGTCEIREQRSLAAPARHDTPNSPWAAPVYGWYKFQSYKITGPSLDEDPCNTVVYYGTMS
jgi:hypothetical protein